jgi:glycosyltransferase involved in cell wall biosynthesis
MRIVLWGTYDTGKPRMRILVRGLVENGIEVVECHREVWQGIEDKSQISGWGRRLGLLARWLAVYPWLIACYLRAPKHEALVVGYMGLVDVLVIWPFAKLRGVPVVWDAFLSLYSTMVEDRKIVGRSNPLAWLVYSLEWLACRATDRVVLDTRAHASYFVDTFKLPARRCDAVWVGAEPEVFPVAVKDDLPATDEKIVLFYGQFIPLHGIETIIRAARQARDQSIRWVIIGSGQEEGRMRKMLDESPLARVEWLPWVNYPELTQWIRRADVCLGIFGDSDKAARVIPNKVFQILMSGKPLITRDSPAIRELLGAEMPGIWLVPAADASALKVAVRESLEEKHGSGLHAAVRQQILPRSIGCQFTKVIRAAMRD